VYRIELILAEKAWILIQDEFTLISMQYSRKILCNASIAVHIVNRCKWKRQSLLSSASISDFDEELMGATIEVTADLYTASRNGTSPEGTRDSGRTLVLSGRNGSARPSIRSLPSLASSARGISTASVPARQLISAAFFSAAFCGAFLPSDCPAQRVRSHAALHHPPGYTGGVCPAAADRH
jgi:hypothetical protein